MLVVGTGVSDIEIALEVSKKHNTYISGKPTLHVPETVFKYAGEAYWWFVNNVITISTPIGRKVKDRILNGGGPFIGVSAEQLAGAGIV